MMDILPGLIVIRFLHEIKEKDGGNEEIERQQNK